MAFSAWADIGCSASLVQRPEPAHERPCLQSLPRPSGRDLGIRYVASLGTCRASPMKSRCCPNMPSRQITRDIDEDARDVARAKMTTKAFLKSRDKRKRVEMRFGHLKTRHRFERLRLRGLSGARDEFHLAALVQNLKTMALRLLRTTPDPFPA